MKEYIAKVIKEMSKKETEGVVLENLEEKTESYVNHLINGIEECESPIEKMMMIEFNASEFNNATFDKLYRMFDVFAIMPQVKIKTAGREEKEYRADFLISAHNQNGNSFNFIVECDGFEHHSTKEKFKNDRIRDRHLLSEGYITIRLSGSEILKDSEACAYEIYRTILNYIENRHRH